MLKFIIIVYLGLAVGITFVYEFYNTFIFKIFILYLLYMEESNKKIKISLFTVLKNLEPSTRRLLLRASHHTFCTGCLPLLIQKLHLAHQSLNQ